MTAAYRQGLKDGQRGDGIQYNPYPMFDRAADEWIQGYRDGTTTRKPNPKGNR